LDWIKEIKRNDNKALKLFYKTYRKDVLLWLGKNYNIDMETGADIFQQSIVLFYDKVIQNKLTDENANVKTYIYGICKNKALTQLRKDKKENSFKKEYSRMISTKENNENDFLEKKNETLSEALDKIGNPCKKILELFYYKMYNIEEISTVLGYKNANTTKTQKYKCIKRLQLMVLAIYRKKI